MKTYHYCATYQNIHYIDGVFTSIVVDLSDKEAYDVLKDQIGDQMHPQREGHEIILLSLTVIG